MSIERAITDQVAVWEILPGNSTPNLFDEAHVAEELLVDKWGADRTWLNHPRPFRAIVENDGKSYANVEEEI